jgi:hypothetical protein
MAAVRFQQTSYWRAVRVEPEASARGCAPLMGLDHKAERQVFLPHSTLSTSISPTLAISPCVSCNWCVNCCCKVYLVVLICALGVKLATADAMLPVEPATERDTQDVT